MKNVFFIFFTIILSISTIHASSDVYINEISFLKPEFVEICSNASINLSNNLFYDEGCLDTSNDLILVDEKDSSIYLIVGDDFLDEYNISNMNASIYKTQKSGLGYYGLKDSGESFVITINSTFNLSWDNNNDYDFELNQTLNYNLPLENYFISSSSPGKLFGNPSLQVNLTDNISINSSQNISLNISSCDILFKILPLENLTFDKLDFEFETNISDFQIEYWIETYRGNVVKSKRNTTNIDKKTYTPDSPTELFFIKANLYSQDCIINDSKLVTYYNTNPVQVIQEKTSTSSSSSNEDIFESESYILISNEAVILNGTSDVLQYEIYKGNTLKRVVNFYLNNEKIYNFELGKYSKIKGSLKLNEFENNNTLVVEGFDIKRELYFSRDSVQKVEPAKKSLSNSPELIFLNTTKSKVHFNLSVQNQNLSILCYVSDVRTKITDVLNITSNQTNTYSLDINNSKLKNSNNMTHELKLYCKYKKPELKTYITLSENFTYIVQNDKSRDISSIILDTYNIQSEQYMSIDTPKENFTSPSIIVDENTQVYISENIKTKESSILYVFLALLLMVIMFIIAW